MKLTDIFRDKKKLFQQMEKNLMWGKIKKAFSKLVLTPTAGR
jgi:hypothetical protein